MAGPRPRPPAALVDAAVPARRTPISAPRPPAALRLLLTVDETLLPSTLSLPWPPPSMPSPSARTVTPRWSSASGSMVSMPDISDLPANGTSVERFKSAVSGRRANILGEITQIDSRGLLLQKAKAAIREKLQELNTTSSSRFAEKRKSEGKLHPCDNNIKVNGVLSDKPGKGVKLCNSRSIDIQVPATDDKNPEQRRVPVSIDVPDPDFHDFDKE